MHRREHRAALVGDAAEQFREGDLLMQVEVPAGLSCDVDLAQLNLSVEDGVRRPLPLPALEPWNAS